MSHGRGHDLRFVFWEHLRKHAAIEVVHVIQAARKASVAFGLSELDTPRLQAIEVDARFVARDLDRGEAAKERVARGHVVKLVNALGGEKAFNEQAAGLCRGARRVVAGRADGLR